MTQTNFSDSDIKALPLYVSYTLA